MKKIAFIFPGQGSQKVGMLSELSESYPLIQDNFQKASEVLGYDLWALVQNGPAEKLNQTEYTQPALLVSSYCLWQIAIQEGLDSPIVLAGHSLGEYSALLAAGVFTLQEAVALVSRRGQLMQNAVAEGDGAMAAIIGLTAEQVSNLCLEISEQEAAVAPANFNSPAQIVIAGHTLAVQKAMTLAKEKGAKRVVQLPVSVPAHCSLMKDAANELAPTFESMTINQPAFPVIHNVDLNTHTDKVAIQNALLEQLHQPVRWIETIEKIKSEYEVDTLIECGPGNILAGLVKRIDKSIKCYSIDSAEGLSTIKCLSNEL